MILISRISDRLAIRIACWLCLVSLATTVWAVFDAGPLVVILAMSVGQGLGMLGVAFYLLVVARDVWKRLRRSPSAPESAPPG